MLPEKKVSLQLSSEHSLDDVGIAQLDWKRVPQARSRGCKSSLAITTECSWHSVVLLATLRIISQQLNIFVTFACEVDIVHAMISCMHHRRYPHFCQIVSMPGLSFSNTVFLSHDARNSSTAAVKTIRESSSSWLNPSKAFMQHFRKGDSFRFLLVIYKVGYYTGVGYVT